MTTVNDDNHSVNHNVGKTIDAKKLTIGFMIYI